MFSSLGPLFKATFRQTEQTDTRQAIIREEKQQGRRKEEEDNARKSDELWEDSTSVSVDALRTFLMNFLKGSELTEKIRESDVPQPVRTPEKRTPADTKTARALGAYESMASKLDGPSAAPPPAAPQSDVDLIESADIRLIHRLISDLEELSGRGIQTLTIEPAESFLKALENAVNALKNP